MQISAINATTGMFKSNYKNNGLQSNPIAKNEVKQNNELLDTNYGSLLVKHSPRVAFGNSAELSKKAAKAYAYMQNNDLLIIGASIAAAKTALEGSLGQIKDIIQSAFIVKDDELRNPVAIRKTNGFDQIINLGKENLYIQRNNKEEAFGGDFFFLKPGEAGVSTSNDYIFVKKPEFGFTLDKTPIKEFDAIEDSFDIIDLSIDKQKDIEEINKKNLTKLKVEEDKEKVQTLKLSDVGGQDEAVAELKKKVLYPIKYPNFFDNNLQGFNSALLVGPPGTGKTLAAQALANEAGIPFYKMNGQLLEGKYVGESAHNIDAYYEMAKANQPCIIFFDEADAIFGKRTGEHKYADDSVNMHLDKISELEKENAKVFLLAATNHPSLIDEGVLRNGRFGTKIEFKAPDTVEKCNAIFDIHTKKLTLENVDKNALSQKMLDAKFNGADIAALATEAKYQAIERQGIFEAMDNGTFNDSPDFKLVITGEDMNKALDKLIANKQTIKDYSKGEMLDNVKEEEPKKIGFVLD